MKEHVATVHGMVWGILIRKGTEVTLTKVCSNYGDALDLVINEVPASELGDDGQVTIVPVSVEFENPWYVIEEEA